MTIKNQLDEFRIFAKRLSRKLQIPHHNALDIIAMQQGHAHWKALMKAWDQGWRPAPWDVIDIKESSVIESPIRGFGKVKTTEGDVAGEPYTLSVYFDEVLIGGNGWGIHLGHAPSEPAEIETYTKPNPLDDKAFFSQVMKIAMAAADEVREAIAKDWGPASMQPEEDGSAKHPLFGGVSSEWHCLHCDTHSTGPQMAANMWHCPKCNASPLDIHPAAVPKEPVPPS
ncbi:hypothetical protein [Bradyrhizobium sp. CCGE-LA001]|uniref:hypothetical protein n=1 Tax=Bradyrhizobium sp. CCGE-LA001 TaxID=1223566 RepID=UPI000745EA3B|nr:hypothetical protein [Bradyrhizobium sp. CCGE-LA001]AMA55194.1 hypothetical protein BCCGELA001_02165 [Bradyrhizobium sp. CCGE-LA001]